MKICVPASSANLGSGFDTLGLALNLKNEVIIKPAKFHSVSLMGEGSNIPAIKDNHMFMSIFNDFYHNLSQNKKNFRFEFFNKIPLTRGLGSSSSVIVSAIASAYSVADVELSKDKLLNFALAYEHHPDNITPAVMGGFNVSTVKNNEVQYINKKIPKHLKAVLVIPNRSMSTNLSRKILPYKYSKEDAVFNISHSSLLSAAFMSENWEMLKTASLDKIHQQYRMRQMPELFNVQKLALNNGALMSTLSGSGSTIFSMCYEENLDKLQKKLKKSFYHFKVITCDFDNYGLSIFK